MNKRRMMLLLLCCFTGGPHIARAVDIQAAPVEQNKPSSHEMDKQNFSVGPTESQEEKSHGVWLNLYENKKMSIGCGISLVPKETLLRGGQSGNSGALDLSAEKVQGCLGFKYSFQ